jgi:hypothetical protein
VRVYRSGAEVIADIASWSPDQLAAMPAARRAPGVPAAGPKLAAPISRALDALAIDDPGVRAAAQALAEDAAVGVAYRRPPWQAPLLEVLGRTGA